MLVLLRHRRTPRTPHFHRPVHRNHRNLARIPSLEAALAECGYLSAEAPAAAGLDEWKDRFSGWIRDPIRREMYRSRPFFDLRPVHGPELAFNHLESHIRAELAAEAGFLQLLANDCLANLPP